MVDILPLCLFIIRLAKMLQREKKNNSSAPHLAPLISEAT